MLLKNVLILKRELSSVAIVTGKVKKIFNTLFTLLSIVLYNIISLVAIVQTLVVTFVTGTVSYSCLYHITHKTKLNFKVV